MSYTTNAHNRNDSIHDVSWNDFSFRPSPEMSGPYQASLAKHVASSPSIMPHNGTAGVGHDRYFTTDFYCQDNTNKSSFVPFVDDPKHRGSPVGRAHIFRPALQDRTNMQPLSNLEPAMTFRPQGARAELSPMYKDQPKAFHPMEAKLGFHLAPFSDQHSPQALYPPQSEAYEKMLAGFSPNYRGNIHLPRNRSADIPSEENCALFIIGLPPTVTVTELLATIRDTGRVYATHINSPEPHRGHETCAAKLIFFERGAAERFYDRHLLGGLQIPGHPGYTSKVVWNRIKTAAPNHPKHYSRVLMIAGPAPVANPVFLTSYFEGKLEFDVDEVFERGGMGDRQLVEYRFGSFRCQAEAAKMAITREFADSGVQVWFGPDPCDVVRPVPETSTADVDASDLQQTLGQVHPARSSQNWRQGTALSQYQFR